MDSSGDEADENLGNSSDDNLEIDLMSTNKRNCFGNTATSTSKSSTLADTIYDKSESDEEGETKTSGDNKAGKDADWDANVLLARNWRSLRARDPAAAEQVLL